MKKPFIIVSSEPCVYCGSRRNQLTCHGKAMLNGTPQELVYQVMCTTCRASGPIAQSAEEAIKGWEHRAQPLTNEAPTAVLPEVEFEKEGAA